MLQSADHEHRYRGGVDTRGVDSGRTRDRSHKYGSGGH